MEIIKKELQVGIASRISKEDNTHGKATVEIVKCISFQKFRYEGERRPGKKYQEKDFITLKFNNLKDKVVRMIIVCVDANNAELIHPNGLVGVNCHQGIFDKEYAITKQFLEIDMYHFERLCTGADSFIMFKQLPWKLPLIPYIRIERMKIQTYRKNIHEILSDRASCLPSPYKERCQSQCTKLIASSHKFDTSKVCLGVIVTVEGNPGKLNGTLHAVSHVIRNASEKTILGIQKLSSDSVPALTGGHIDIFTTEKGPDIVPDSWLLSVSCKSEVCGTSWESDKYSPSEHDILYKRVISYQVPCFELMPSVASPVEAILHLECPESNLQCSCSFYYVPQTENLIQTYREENASCTEYDFKPPLKKLRTETYDDDSSSENIKSSLKSEEEVHYMRTETYDDDSSSENIKSSLKSEEEVHYSDVHTNPVLVYTTDGTVIGQMDASAVEPLYTQAMKDEEQVVFSSFGHEEEQKSILPDDISAASVIYNSNHTQGVAITDRKPHSHDSVIENSNDQQEDSQTSSDYMVPLANNRYFLKLISQGASNISSTITSGSSDISVYNSAPFSSASAIPLLQNMFVSGKASSNASPWQVDEV